MSVLPVSPTMAKVKSVLFTQHPWIPALCLTHGGYSIIPVEPTNQPTDE